jgi:uncharacterized membrane protein
MFGKYLTVFLGSMLKFFAGPVSGLALGLGFWESLILTVAGMMTTVLLLTLLGPQIRRLWVKLIGKEGRKFTRRNRLVVRVWQRFGLIGVSFMTPILFTPIGGSLLANMLEKRQAKIITYMFYSAVFWSFVVCGALYGIGLHF